MFSFPDFFFLLLFPLQIDTVEKCDLLREGAPIPPEPPVGSWKPAQYVSIGQLAMCLGWGKLGVPSPALLTYLCLVGLVLVRQIFFCFVGLPFFPSASWPLSFLSLFFLFLRPCLIHARMPDWGRAFVHGHTFLHSWSGPMTLAVGLLHGAAFLSNLPLVLFVSFIGP